MVENITLFEEHSMDEARLEIIEAEFIAPHRLKWQELFAGFDKLYAITYSASIGFIYELLQLFGQAEVVFGCEHVINYSVASLINFQSLDIQELRENSEIRDYLTGRIGSGNLRLNIAMEKLSHEKIYLLESNDGRKRVIEGSANMSRSAFTGNQLENITYYDGEKAFVHYMEHFQNMLASSTNKISKDALLFADNAANLDKLPISQHIKVENVMIIEPKVEPDAQNKIKHILDLHNQTQKLDSIIPKDRKGGKVIVSADMITTISKRAIVQNHQEKEAREEFPQLVIDCEAKAAHLNDSPLDLCPADDEVRKDIRIFLAYMQGFEKFHGNTAQMQRRYFEFAVWFFATPFFATLRNTAKKSGRNYKAYPAFGLLYGKSKME